MVDSRIPVIALLASCSLWGVTAGGCLEVRSGHRAGTGEGDTLVARDTQIGDTHGTEPGPETADSGTSEVDAPDVDLCADQHCDDGDPCSVDRCSAASGACTHERVVGCDACAAGCEDGDPCTDDGCILGQCEHQALEGCAPACSGIDLSTIANAHYAGPEGTFVKTRGTAQMARNGECLWLDVGMCMCQAGIALVDGEEEMGLFPGWLDDTLGPPITFECRSADSESAPSNVRVECDPLQAGVNYRVWGTGSYQDGAFAPGGLVPVRPLTSIAVQGYCLDTSSEEALGGDYAVTVTFDDGPEVPMHASIGRVDVGELITLRPDDPNDNVVGVTGGVVERLDNGIRFQFNVDGGAPYGVDYLIARLVARENRLEGRFVSTWAARGPMWGSTGISNASLAAHVGSNGDGVFRPVTSGRIVLERLPPADGVRSPCP